MKTTSKSEGKEKGKDADNEEGGATTRSAVVKMSNAIALGKRFREIWNFLQMRDWL